VLGSSAKTLATAAPPDPLQAAQIRCGMRAAGGAIEGVKIVDGDVQLTVIGDVEAVGLCGSGLVDAVAELLGAGMLDRSGRFVLDASDRFAKIGEENVFHLSDDVFLSQRDVRELQFAKRRSRPAGILCRDLGVEARGDSRRCCSAARSGSYLSAASAVKIGLVPKLPLVRIVSAGNVAGEGAKNRRALGHRARSGERDPRRGRVRRALRRTDFNDLFIDQLSFPV